jgi:type I restriction enzyme, S subunit
MMNTKVSYGSLAPAMIGGLGIIVRTLNAKASLDQAPVTLKKLPDVIEFCDSGIWGDESLDESVEPRVFRVSDFAGDFRLNYDSAPARSLSKEKLEKFQVQPGDILVVKSSGSANQVVSGRVAVFDCATKQRYVASNFLLRLRPKPSLDPHYLAFVLGSPPIREAVADLVKTMTYPNLSFRIYREIEVPAIPLKDQHLVAAFFDALLNKKRLPELPDYLSDQRRIVARIEELAAKINEARTLREQSVVETESLYNSKLRSAYNELAAHYGTSGLDQLLVGAGYGSSEKCDLERAEGAIPVLRIPNVASERITLNNLKYARLSQHDQERLLLEEGDILVVRTNGSLDLVGRSAVVEEMPEPMAFASYMIRLRFDQGRMLPGYTQRMLRHLRTAGEMVDFARTTAGQYNVSLGRLQSAKIPVPPIPEQRRVVEELDALQEQVDALKKLQSETATELDALLPSVLDKAFRGNL